MELNKIYKGDCFEELGRIKNNSIDLILTDPPYKMTNAEWDKGFDIKKMWLSFKRVIKKNGVIVITASQPFTSRLIMSNLTMFKYEIIWEKEKITNFLAVKKQIGKIHENILIFYRNRSGEITYNPQMELCDERFIDRRKNHTPTQVKTEGTVLGKKRIFALRKIDSGLRYPKSVLKIKREKGSNFHPTQKPEKLFDYIIKTFSNEGDTVLDPFSGSGTTGVSCIKNKRNFILIEKDITYYEKSLTRIKDIVENSK